MASKTVLVIDADSETEQIIASTLETEGYLVFAVPGGDVGAEMAQKVSPSLIFVDPGDMSEKGMAVCGTIRGYESLKTVPIILLASVPAGTDLSPYGVVDTISLPAGAAELLEKTEKAIDAKSPVVLRVREKVPSLQKDKMQAAEELFPESHEGALPKRRLSDLSEIADMEAEGEEARKDDRKDSEKIAEFSYLPEEEGAKRKSNKTLVALVVILLIVAGVAGALYYSELIPGIGLQTNVPPPGKAEKAKKQEPAPAAQQEMKPAAAEKTASAPDTAQTPSAAASAPKAAIGKSRAEVSSAEPPASAKAAPAAKPSGKTLYSIQVGVFKSETNAGTLTNKLKGKGYDAFTLKSSVKEKGTVYRVLVGKFEDRKKSQEMASQIGRKENMKPVIYSE